MPSSRGSSQPRDQTQVSHTAGGFFTTWAISTRKPYNIVIIIRRFHESKCSAHFLAEIKLLQTLTVTGRMPPSRESPGYKPLLFSYCRGVNWAGQSAALETDMYSVSPGPCHRGNSFYPKDTDTHRTLSSAVIICVVCSLRSAWKACLCTQPVTHTAWPQFVWLLVIVHLLCSVLALGLIPLRNVLKGFAKTIWWQSPGLLQHEHFVELGAPDWNSLTPSSRSNIFSLFHTDNTSSNSEWMSVSIAQVIYSSYLRLDSKSMCHW